MQSNQTNANQEQEIKQQCEQEIYQMCKDQWKNEMMVDLQDKNYSEQTNQEMYKIQEISQQVGDANQSLQQDQQQNNIIKQISEEQYTQIVQNNCTTKSDNNNNQDLNTKSESQSDLNLQENQQNFITKSNSQQNPIQQNQVQKDSNIMYEYQDLNNNIEQNKTQLIQTEQQQFKQNYQNQQYQPVQAVQVEIKGEDKKDIINLNVQNDITNIKVKQEEEKIKLISNINQANLQDYSQQQQFHQFENQNDQQPSCQKTIDIQQQEAFEKPLIINISPNQTFVQEELKTNEQKSKDLLQEQENINLIIKQIKDYADIQRYDLATVLYNQILAIKSYQFQELQQDQKNIINDVISINKDIDFLEQQIKQNEGWNQESFSEKIKIYYKQLKESNTVSIKVEAMLDIPIFNLCALIYEIELFTNWVPFCDKSLTLKRIKRAEKLVQINLGLPFISDREGIIDGFGIDRLEENGTILIICKTVHDNQEFLQRNKFIIPENKNVKFDLNFFFCEITPYNENQLSFKAIANVDPKFNFIPKMVLNFFVRKIGGYMIQKLIKLSQNIKGTQWEQNMNKEENKEFYEWLGKRIKETIYNKK